MEEPASVTPEITLAELAAKIDAQSVLIQRANVLLEQIAEQVEPVITKLLNSPIIKMLGGK